jgi:hypothetical protein
MAVAALKFKPVFKTYHAIVQVTRIEQWCVEAQSVEEARELLAAGGALVPRRAGRPPRSSNPAPLERCRPACVFPP